MTADDACRIATEYVRDHHPKWGAVTGTALRATGSRVGPDRFLGPVWDVTFELPLPPGVLIAHPSSVTLEVEVASGRVRVLPTL